MTLLKGIQRRKALRVMDQIRAGAVDVVRDPSTGRVFVSKVPPETQVARAARHAQRKARKATRRARK